MTFWGLWCVASIALTAFVGFKCIPEYGVASLLLLLSFPIPLLIVGLVFFYQAMLRHHAEYGISLTKDTLHIQKNLLGRTTLTVFPRTGIRHICRIPTTKHADANHEAIEIRSGKQRVRFGEHLDPEERSKLVDEMRLRVFGPPVLVAEAAPSSVPIPDSFSFLITHRMLHELPFASAAMVTGALFMVVVLRFMSFEHSMNSAGEPVFFRAIEWVATMAGNLMRVLFFIIALCMISGGLWMWIRSLRIHLRQTSLEGTPAQIIVRKLDKHGRLIGEKTYPRNGFTTIRTSIQTITGGVTLKRIELLRGDDSTTIVSDVRSGDAEEIMKRLSE